MEQQNRRAHALVLGGSMGGLLAARVLADHYERVTLLERDMFPPLGEHRKGVPQSRHTHGLLVSGARVLERWFPGFQEELIEDGAVAGDIAAAGRWFNEGACLTRFKSGLEGLLMTRPFLEGRLRRRVLELPNIAARQGLRVGGLTVSCDGRRVTGVKAGDEEIAADIVIDATGRGSRSREWLAAFGYPKPKRSALKWHWPIRRGSSAVAANTSRATVP